MMLYDICCILYYIFYLLFVFILEFVSYIYLYIGDDIWDNILG